MTTNICNQGIWSFKNVDIFKLQMQFYYQEHLVIECKIRLK